MSDHETLGCEPNATFEELRAAYLKLARKLHPDKSKGVPSEEFLKVQKAWERIQKQLESTRKLQSAAQEIDLDDLSFDEASETYLHPCRCGDQILVPCEALENHADIFSCPSCSLRIRVVYEAVEDE